MLETVVDGSDVVGHEKPFGVFVKGTRFQIPAVVTPFTVLGLLREIEHNNGLAAAQKQELATSIQQLEHHYFASSNGSDPDLKKIAETWVARAS